jgi:hypothetical protein
MELSRTHHADQAIHLADLVNLKFAKTTFGLTTRRVLRISEPDGPSTDGGRKARQSIMLAPEEGNPGGTIVCGWVDVVRRTAELKTHSILGSTYQERYGVAFDLSRGEYQRVLDALLDFLRGLEIETRVTNMPRKITVITPLPSAPKPQPTIVRPKHFDLLLVASGAMFGFSLCYLLAALRWLGF